MPTKRNPDSFQIEVETIKDRLEAVERQELSKQQEKLQKCYDDLAGKLSELKGAITVVGLVFTVVSLMFAVLSTLAGTNVFKYQVFEATRKDTHELLVVLFEDKIADTIDRVSFVDPPDKEQSYKIQELRKMQEQLRRLKLESERFESRSLLADSIYLIVENNTDEAISKLTKIAGYTAGRDSFAYSRALILKAIALIRLNNRHCVDPVSKLVTDAVNSDSQLAAGFNILGLCRSQEAWRLLKSQSDKEWADSSKAMQDAIRYYELSFSLKPTPWARSKSLNNQVWGNSKFLEAGFDNEDRIKQHLDMIGYKNIGDFFDGSLKNLAVCKLLSPHQPGWWETEAELQGLRNAYYEGKDDQKAADALANMREQYIDAINRCLFCNHPTLDKALEYFRDESLLKKLHKDEEIIRLIGQTVGHN